MEANTQISAAKLKNTGYCHGLTASVDIIQCAKGMCLNSLNICMPLTEKSANFIGRSYINSRCL